MEHITQEQLVNASWVQAPAINFGSPLPYFLKTYSNTTIPLAIIVYVFDDSPEITSISYSLDGNAKVLLTDFVKSEREWYSPDKVGSVLKAGFRLRAESTLENLAEGNHTLKVSTLDANGGVMSSEETFTVNSTNPPPTPTVPEFPSWIILILFMTIALPLLVYSKKHKRIRYLLIKV
jgi:hypothetical protein